MELVNIAFVFDDKFSDLFPVAAYSAAKNTVSDLAIYVVDCGISPENREKILQFGKKFANIRLIEFGIPERIDVFEKFPMPKHFSSAVFYRLVIPKVFPDLKRVIYMDCDVIVDGDIAELWNEDLGGRPFGAIEEDGNFFDAKALTHYREKLRIFVEEGYFNSGILLIDCKKFEASNILERVISCARNTKIAFLCPEQDAMNVCLDQDEHMPLSPRYGFIPYAPLAKACLKKIGKPLITHYALFKPWSGNRPIIRAFHAVGLFRYSTAPLVKFWKYADGVGFVLPQKKSGVLTLRFFFKRVFQPVEQFFKWHFRTKPSLLWKKHFGGGIMKVL
jgi:lipopolysaccharide biosynthesis glycosyltransferase